MMAPPPLVSRRSDRCFDRDNAAYNENREDYEPLRKLLATLIKPHTSRFWARDIEEKLAETGVHLTLSQVTEQILIFSKRVQPEFSETASTGRKRKGGGHVEVEHRGDFDRLCALLAENMPPGTGGGRVTPAKIRQQRKDRSIELTDLQVDNVIHTTYKRWAKESRSGYGKPSGAARKGGKRKAPSRALRKPCSGLS